MPTPKSTTNTFIATQDKQRLDKFLVEQLPDITRSQIQKLIKSGDVKVNGEETNVHHFLKGREY